MNVIDRMIGKKPINEFTGVSSMGTVEVVTPIPVVGTPKKKKRKSPVSEMISKTRIPVAPLAPVVKEDTATASKSIIPTDAQVKVSTTSQMPNQNPDMKGADQKPNTLNQTPTKSINPMSVLLGMKEARDKEPTMSIPAQVPQGAAAAPVANLVEQLQSASAPTASVPGITPADPLVQGQPMPAPSNAQNIGTIMEAYRRYAR